MNEEAVEPQEIEPMDQMVEDALQDHHDEQLEEESGEKVSNEPKMIPLHVAQKLREKKRELELELQFEKQERQRLMALQSQPQAPKEEEEDNSRYESATKADLRSSQDEAVRIIEERLWIKQNPEKYDLVSEHLPKLLKQRPNLASAIDQASNRYEEAYFLMSALTPKQQQQIKKEPVPKKEAPNAPGSVPKAAVLNDAVDLMNMSDQEFAAWRASKKRAR